MISCIKACSSVMDAVIEGSSLKAHEQYENPEYRFDFWDFGGQELYYTSHQTFLTQRGIYLVIVDLTQPPDKELDTGESERKAILSPETPQGISLTTLTV